MEHRGSLGSSTPCCATASEVESCPTTQSPGSLSVLAGRDIPHRGPKTWSGPQPPMLLPGLHLNPAMPGPDPSPLLSRVCDPGVPLSICASSGATAANKCVGSAAAVQQTEAHGEGNGGSGPLRPQLPATSALVPAQPQPYKTNHVYSAHKLNVSDSTAPSPLPALWRTVGVEASTSTAPCWCSPRALLRGQTHSSTPGHAQVPPPLPSSDQTVQTDPSRPRG